MDAFDDTPTVTFPYHLEARVGEGSMGVVFRALEPRLNRPVAIKFLRDEKASERSVPGDDLRRRFLQEARAVAALSHPGITTIYSIGEKDGTPYIAMEWLEGRTLEQMLAAEGPLPLRTGLRLGVELLEALEAAHRAGVVHRDIKPSNLIVLRDGRLKVTDFGIAHVRDSDIVKTQPGLVLATPRFASPEQLSGAEVDGRSDIFSAGVVLYHALTGTYPFAGRSLVEIATALLQSDPEPASAHAPGIPVELDDVLARALERDRTARFASARDMADALRRVPSAQYPTLAVGAPQVMPFDDGASLSTYVSETVEASYPSVTGMSTLTWEAVVDVVKGWPSTSLRQGPTSLVIERLVERPLHARPFAGAVRFDTTYLLVEDGLILGAVEVTSGRCHDAAVEELPAIADAAIHPVPPQAADEVISLLATLLRPPHVLQSGLDSSIVNLGALAEKLERDAFDGVVRLRRGEAEGLVLFAHGRTVLTLYSSGWDAVPITSRWDSWASRIALAVSVEAKAADPLFCSYQMQLAGCELAVAAVATEPARVAEQTLLRLRSGDLHRPTVVRAVPPSRPGATFRREVDAAFVASDPMIRFLEWGLSELSHYFRERERSARWRYLSEWLPLVRGARIHHSLERPTSRDTDPFGLVTFDGGGKVLHVADRVAHVTADRLLAFRDRVVAAKTARLGTGDIGGAFLVAPSFDEEALEVYRNATKPETTTRSLLGLEEKLTRYEGFVRLGPRRGFHLLLVAETSSGFEPLLPT